MYHNGYSHTVFQNADLKARWLHSITHSLHFCSYTVTSVAPFTGLNVLCLAFLRRSLLDLAVQCQSQCTPTFALIKLFRCVCTFASPSHPAWIGRPIATVLSYHKSQCFSLNILQTWLEQGCTQPTL